MASDFVIGLGVGLLACLVLFGLLAVVWARRSRQRHADAVVERDAAIVELRQELAYDKETNRRLRHELAVNTPGNLLETANTAEIERNGAISERDQAIEQLGLVADAADEALVAREALDSIVLEHLAQVPDQHEVVRLEDLAHLNGVPNDATPGSSEELPPPESGRSEGSAGGFDEARAGRSLRRAAG